MALHIHVGHNVPGYLPESDVMCFGSVDDALDALRHELTDQQEYYLGACEGDFPDGCECGWCDAASDCEAALSAIADGDAAFCLTRDGARGWHFTPPEGPDMYHWVTLAADPRDDCEIFADQGE